MSATDILEQQNNWMTSGELVKKLANLIQKKKPSIKPESAERNAYRQIVKEVKTGLIRRITNPDRSVVYGLPNWPYNKLDEKVDKALKKYKESEYTQVSLVDLANMVGAPPNKIEELAYHLAYKYGLSIGPKTTHFARSREAQERLMRRLAEERKKG